MIMRGRGLKLGRVFVATVISLGIVFSSLLPAASVYADATTELDKTKQWVAANWLRACFANASTASINKTNGPQYKWFDNSGGSRSLGHIITGSEGASADCADSNRVRQVVELLKWNDKWYSLPCALNYRQLNVTDKSQDGSAKTGENCFDESKGDDWVLYKPGAGRNSTQWPSGYSPILRKVTTNSSLPLSNLMRYFIGYETFRLGCGGTYVGNDAEAKKLADAPGEDYQYIDEVDNNNGSIVIAHNVYKVAQHAQDQVTTHVDEKGDNIDYTCKQLAQMTQQYAKDLAELAKKDPTQFKNTKDQLATDATNNRAADEQGSGDGKSSCLVDGIGWLVCPVMRFVAGLNDKLYEFISSQMVVETKLIDTSSPTYQAWSIFKDYANIIFVIAFLVIVYSQITSYGFSNYSLKKMIPRLVVAAILVNISFIVCQLAVDVSNLLGASANGLFQSIGSTSLSANSSNVGFWKEIIGKLLAGLLGGLAMLFLLLAISFPMLIAAFLALAMVAMILILRKAFLVLLIVVSPVAFVLYLLPNTEQWFKKWFKAFTSLLLVYFIIAIVYGASSLAAKILNAGADASMQLAALGATALPFFVVPSLLKNMLNSLGTVGAKIGGITGKAMSATTGGAKRQIGERYKRSAYARGKEIRKAGKEQYRRRGFSESVTNPQTRMDRMRRRFARGVGVTRGDKYAQEQLARTAEAQYDQDFEKDVSAANVAQQKMLNSDVEEIANARNGKTASGKEVSRAEQTAAARSIMKSGNHEQRMKLVGNSAGQDTEVKQAIRDGAYAAGMNKYLGGGIGDSIMEDKITGQDDLDMKIAETAQAGKLNAEGLVADGTGINRIKAVMEATQGNTSAAMNVSGVSHTVNVAALSGRVDAAHLKQVGQAAKEATTLPATKGRISGNMTDSVEHMAKY